MQSFKKFIAEADKYCSDKCCGTDVKAEDCPCPADCPHCDCNAVKNETFDPKHPKVVAARKAHKAGTYDGNMDKNGNAIVHIDGKPHTVTKGDPAAKYKNEEVEEVTENYTHGSEKSMKGGHRALLKNPQGKTSYLGGTAYKKPKHAEGEAKAYHDAYFNGPVKNNDRGATRAVADYRKKNAQHIHKESFDENELAAQYINENNISMAELEAMSPEQLDEIIGKALGGIAKAAIKTGAAAIGAGQAAKRRVSTAGRADAAEKKAASLEKKASDRKRIATAKQRVKAAKDSLRAKTQAAAETNK